ncbi:MAG: CDP-glycerol glycerophosphotransferase family protein, partial [Clostridiales bacterium]|nr:CDP-glycerol glycerophosphotransferase family protein [Clostridiales bacterium]
MENEASIKSRRLAVLLFMSERDDLNRKTLDSLLAQDIREDVGYIVFAPSEKDYLKSFAADKGGVFYISSGCISKDFNRANKIVSRKGLVTFMEAGDTFGRNYLSKMVMRATSKSPRIGDYYMVSMPAKISSVNGEYDIFAKKPAKKKFYKPIVPNREIRFDTMFSTIPRMLRGTWIRGDYFTTHDMDETAVYDAEKAYLYDLAVSSNIMMFSQDTDYSFAGVTDADFRLFQPFYEREFYYDDLNGFWVPYLQKYKKKGRIPTIIQHMAFYELCTRTEANTNNRNKHVVPEEEAYDYLKSWKPVLDLLEDDVILNTYNQAYIRKHPCVHRLMLKIKYDDEDLRYDLYYFKNKFYYGKQNLLVNMMSSQSVDIIYMECKDGVLHLDCEVSDLYFNGKGDFGVELNDVPVPYKLTERYAHTKLFGKSIYKRLAFEADVKLEDVNEQRIRFVYNNEHGRMVIPITFGSHTSKLSKRFRNCYWCFRSDDLNFMAIHNQNSILVKKAGRLSRFKKEQRLRFEMFFKGFRDKKAFIFWLVRLAYFFFKPFMKKRPIWLFFDKIYKGGDSAEYIYKYSCAQDDGIDKYYLIDRKAADYKRLKAEGYKPLVRGSIKHRLIFLYSDLVIVSNSTVFEFNDYSIQTSSYIRDLVDFSVACVQHGMSIQKIAVAQNRLRDNTRLYFCASNYEIENLNRPVYDYAGRDILKLTGVPRYDGLKDCDKKQILISPTWRMQAALAPNGNEGVEREYNPLFKESDYYKIYNSLINDEMLIAAAEKYGYKILYVLHPIVSPQLRDFDRNEFVEIVPSVGDFSYEKAFCESSLMVTDYSGVQFDFAYMR